MDYNHKWICFGCYEDELKWGKTKIYIKICEKSECLWWFIWLNGDIMINFRTNFIFDWILEWDIVVQALQAEKPTNNSK